MTAKIIDGKAHARAMREHFKSEIEILAARGSQPGLAVVLVGDDPASQVYVRNKQKACVDAGMHSEVHRMAAQTSQATLLDLVESLNANPKIHGILVQLPLPRHIDSDAVFESISPAKDVDCFHPYNVGRMALGGQTLYPCTPHGIISLLEREGIEVSGKHAVVVGRSNIVGKPMALLLINRGATVTVCNSRTADLAGITRAADILIVAVGKLKLITADMVKPGAVVIDVGIHRLADGKLAGDVDFGPVAERAAYITPVPGGVGPMTITMLLANTLAAALSQQSFAGEAVFQSAPDARQGNGAMTETTTASGLVYEDLRIGDGETVSKGQIALVHYTGWLNNAARTRFDSSKEGKPFSFPLGEGRVIPGWDEGVQGMRIGGVRKLVIPPELGYGARGAGGVIPPNATLIFEVELIAVR